jgi:predicted O-methyltransferase YrrM
LKKKDKLAGIIKNRKQLLPAVNMLLYNKSQEEKLKIIGIESLPEVSPGEFFSIFENDYKTLKIITDFSTGISPVNDYYFLCRLAKCLKAENYFEFGTWLGLSARNISETMGSQTTIYTLDIPPDHPDIKTYGIPQSIFGNYAKGLKNVHFLQSDSKSFDFSVYKGKIDLVFVDGNHSVEYVESDTRNALTLLRNESSVIAWHDYMVLGEVNKEVLCGILNAIPENERKHLFYLKQSNMAIFSRSFNFKAKSPVKWEIPESAFILEIKSESNSA